MSNAVDEFYKYSQEFEKVLEDDNDLPEELYNQYCFYVESMTLAFDKLVNSTLGLGNNVQTVKDAVTKMFGEFPSVDDSLEVHDMRRAIEDLETCVKEAEG